MKVFIITLFAAAFLSVEASPKPGGYTLKGGVDYRLQQNKPAGHFKAAKIFTLIGSRNSLHLIKNESGISLYFLNKSFIQ